MEAEKKAPLISAAVSSALESFGYAFEQPDGDDDMRFWIRSGEGMWRANFVINPEASLLRLYVFLFDASEYSEEMKRDVFELAARLNEVVVIGAVGVGFDKGLVFYRSCLDLRRITPSQSIIVDFLNASAFPIQTWETSLEFLTGGRMGAEIALEASLMVS